VLRSISFFEIGDIDRNTNWTKALEGVNCIIHCAARAHVLKEYEISPLDAYRRVNVYATESLAEQAVDMGIKRFVYVSSIGVNGPKTEIDRSFTSCDPVMPSEDYAISKSEAEKYYGRSPNVQD